jgi:hypothetical protein
MYKHSNNNIELTVCLSMCRRAAGLIGLYIYERLEHLLRLWIGIWLHILIITTTDTSPDLWEFAESYLMQVCKPCHFAFIEAVESCKLYPMSMSYIIEVFEHLLRLWMDIWLDTHTITTTDISPDLWELAEILPDESVQTMQLRFGWGCRTFQIASHVHVIHIWGVWVPPQVVDGHIASHSHHYHHTMDQSIEAEELC